MIILHKCKACNYYFSKLQDGLCENCTTKKIKKELERKKFEKQ